MRTRVYVDGFNLYYGLLKGTGNKWLDLAAFCRRVLQRHHVIDRIHYCTAHVKPRADNPSTHVRQQVYLRALKTLPEIEIHEGSFLSHPKRMPLVHPPASGPRTVEVISTQEKGSDVNLATFLVCEAYEKLFDCAVVVSNDSDLVTPIVEVKRRLKVRVGLICPHPKPSAELGNVVDFRLTAKASDAAKSQFAPELKDAHGTIKRPREW